jgi:hypothetical protein
MTDRFAKLKDLRNKIKDVEAFVAVAVTSESSERRAAAM